MTIDQAIERINDLQDILQREDFYNEHIDTALKMAVYTLEDSKEYRLKEFQCHLAQQEGISIGYNQAIDEIKRYITTMENKSEETCNG